MRLWSDGFTTASASTGAGCSSGLVRAWPAPAPLCWYLEIESLWPPQTMARKCLLAHVQVWGRRLCFLPAGILPGVLCAILLTVHVLALHCPLDHRSRTVPVVSLGRTAQWRSIIFHHIPPFYGRLTTSGSYCTHRNISMATSPFLTLLCKTFPGLPDLGHSLRKGRTKRRSICSLTQLKNHWARDYSQMRCYCKTRFMGTQAQGSEGKVFALLVLTPQHLVFSIFSINTC